MNGNRSYLHHEEHGAHKDFTGKGFNALIYQFHIEVDQQTMLFFLQVSFRSAAVPHG